MVVGNGMIATAFKPDFEQDDSVVIFASGVSNSQETDPSLYAREFGLLALTIKQNPNKKLVYFSTCSIEDDSRIIKGSLYVKHKVLIEKFIEFHCKKYVIFRLSNVIGETQNPHTLINYLFSKIQKEQTFDLWLHSTRNLLDVEDVVVICKQLIDLFETHTFVVANAINYSMEEIVGAISECLHKNAFFRILETESNPKIAVSGIVVYLLRKLRPCPLDENYLSQLLNKYYGK